MSGDAKPDEAAVRKARRAAQQTLGKLIGDDDACARANAGLPPDEDGPAGEAPPGDGPLQA